MFALLEPAVSNLKIKDEEKVALGRRMTAATKCMKSTKKKHNTSRKKIKDFEI